MLISKNDLFLTTTFAALALLSACGGNDDKPATETKTASLSGRIAASEQARLSGANVTAYRVEASGALTAVTSGEAKLDDSGRYSLTVDVTSGAIDAVLVRAKAAGGEGAVLASSPAVAGKTLVLAPIDAETTAEADVDLAALALAGAEHRSVVARDLVRAFVTSELAASLDEGDRTTNVQAAARAMIAGLSARSSFLQSDAASVSAEQLSAFLADTAHAQATLDVALDAVTSTSAAAAAAATYASAIEAAYASAAIFAEERAAAGQAVTEAMMPYAVLAPTAVRASLVSSTELERAADVARLVARELEVVELDVTEKKSMEDAALALQADVRAALAADMGSDVMVRAAWKTYAESITSELELSLPLAERLKWLEVQLGVQGAGSALGVALAGLTSVAAPFTTGEAAAQAIANYRGSVLSDSNISTLMAASIPAERARAMAEILFALGVATHGADLTAE